MYLKQRIKQHIRDNRWQYLLILLIFIAGVALGSFKVSGLEGGVRTHLLQMLDNYLKGGIEGNLNGSSIFASAFFHQSKTILLIWFLGLTVIGFPLILAVVFFRGFSLGFTLKFLFQEKAGAGIVLSFISVLPQNIVYIPFLIMWAVVAINASLYLIKDNKNNYLPLGSALIGYNLLMPLFIVIFLLGAFIEAYLSPWLLRLLL